MEINRVQVAGELDHPTDSTLQEILVFNRLKIIYIPGFAASTFGNAGEASSTERVSGGCSATLALALLSNHPSTVSTVVKTTTKGRGRDGICGFRKVCRWWPWLCLPPY